MKRDSMEDLIENTDVSEEYVNRKMNETLDSFDLSRRGRRSKKKEDDDDFYDITSLLEDELDPEQIKKGVVTEDKPPRKREGEGGDKKDTIKDFRDAMGLPSRDEILNPRDKNKGSKRTKGNEEDEKDGKIWKILGALGIAVFVNNLVGKIANGKSEGGSEGRGRSGRTPLEHIATLVAIILGCTVITSFAFYVIGALGYQDLPPTGGFIDKVEYLLKGDKEEDISITGVQVETYIKPYRTINDDSIEVLGRDNEKIIFPLADLPEQYDETGYVNLTYTTDAYTKDVIDLDITKVHNMEGEEDGDRGLLDTLKEYYNKTKIKIENIIK